jgi:hypothetical protein
MANIEIDFDVYKALTALRESEDVTYNDVIRSLLNIKTEEVKPVGWFSKGVFFPNGTEFRATFKNMPYEAKVQEKLLIYDEVIYNTLSEAAFAITKTPRNGWDFWECKVPNDRWRKCSDLRKK